MNVSKTVSNPDPSLDQIRREIDAIDDALLNLVVQRLDATGMVRATKQSDGSLASSPLRPAREASMLRRLVARGTGRIAPEHLVRLWRVILSTSTQAQAPVCLHIDSSLADDVTARLLIAEHFCGMKIESHSGIGAAFGALHTQRGDLAIMMTKSAWADGFAEAAPTGMQLVGSLPVLSQEAMPKLIVFGHAEPQPSGQDETIVMVKDASLTNAIAPNWQIRSGSWTVASLPGFLTRDDVASLNPTTSQGRAELLIAGRYPAAIEVNS